MAMYDSNTSYKCNYCGHDLFEERTIFSIDNDIDKTKLTNLTIKRKSCEKKIIYCVKCNVIVYEKVLEEIK